MERNREGRRPNMAVVTNGVSRRRHRSNSLRDSPDENGPVELSEHSRLRDRGGLKKDRDRERERSSRSKRRRGSNREEGGDDSSEEEEEEETTVNEEDDEVYDVLPPNHQQQKMSRNFRSGPAADEMIGVSVPRKARSASTKRMHDWISGGGGGGGVGVGGDLNHRQESASPEESASSFRKKTANNGSTKPRPHHPKSCTRPVSSNPEELEIEIAEVLYGLSHASNNDTAKIDSREVNKSSSDAKSRVSSPTSNTPSSTVVPQSSSLLPQNSSTVAPKRKRPRQVVENLGNLSSTKMKVEVEINQQNLNNEISSLNLEKNSAENDLPVETKLELSVLSANPSTEEEGRDMRFIASTKKDVTSSKESSPVGLVADREDATMTATIAGMKVMDIESQREGKYQIDLMAPPPPQLRSSPNREGVINFAAASDSNLMVSSNVDAVTEMTDKEVKKVGKIGNGEAVNVRAEEKAKEIMEEAGSHKPVVNKEIDNGNKLQHEVPKPQLPPTKVARDEPNMEKNAQPNSFPLPMSVASWPGGLPPMGYMAPLQGVVSMDGSTMSSTPIQPLFSQPRGKRCATHYNIAQNIHYIQQLMKMNPFWPAAAAGSAPLYGAKPCNFNVMSPAEFNGNITARSISSVPDKGQGITIFPGNSEKDKGSHTDQRKQPILLQQTVPAVAPNNMLHGPAFIFPFNQQQTAVAAASARPGSAKSPTTPGNLASSGSNSAMACASSTAATAAATMSFNFPNMPVNETQYLAILQNNAYPFPIPAVGAPPNYRGTHPQAMPLLNGSFYPSQMIHPHQMQQAHQNTNTSSGSSSSQKHLQGQQQRPQGSSVNSGSGNGNFHNFPAPKNRQSQQQNQQHINPPPARQLENETGGEDSPSTADSRVSQSRPPMGVYYGQNFSMSIHPQSLAAGLPGARASTGSGNQNEKKHQQQQAFAMSFAPMNGSGTALGIDIASQFAQNHAIIQSLPEATRQSYQNMAAAAAAQAAQHKKHFGVSEEGKAGGGDVTNVDEERKGPAVKSPPNAGQSVAFSRSELADASVSGVGASGSFSVSNSHLSPLYQHQQQQINQVQNQKLVQQQLIKLQQHHDQQQHLARSKPPATSNGGAYPQHLTSSVSVAEKFQNMLTNFPQCYKQKSNSSSSPSQSPQWKNSAKTPAPQVPSSLSSSTTSSLKNHTQISFGSTQKPSQPPNNNSSPSAVVVGSPTHSSISKGATASPRSITTSTSNKIGQVSTLSPQQAKNPPSAPTQKPSILGNPPVTSSSSVANKSQMQQQQQSQQFSKQAMQQAQLFFSNHYMQPPQAPHTTSSTVSASSGYYLQRKRPEQQPPPGSSGSGSSTSDPAKAVAAATSFASNTKGGSLNSQFGAQSSGNMQLPPGFSYVNTVPTAVQVKPAEQKQPAA